MVNMMKLMKQAADMQKNMQKVQEQLAEEEVTFTSGGGAVTAVVKGDMSFSSIKIDPKVVDPEDVEMLEDLVQAAVEGAFREAKEVSEAAISKVTGGMNIPGLG